MPMPLNSLRPRDDLRHFARDSAAVRLLALVILRLPYILVAVAAVLKVVKMWW